MNVHRWRRLEGSDPATYEMVQKIQTLQRRLIAKTEEVVERDLQLQVDTTTITTAAPISFYVLLVLLLVYVMHVTLLARATYCNHYCSSSYQHQEQQACTRW
jgi:hypothetical protein